jgi:anti-sigma regulatory factor (Ser/Thr protein kinase)
MTAPATPTHFTHEAAFYRDDDEFLDLISTYVREGLALDEAVVVVEPEPRLGLLRTALGADAADVEWFDMLEVGANPGRIIPLWADAVAAHAGTGRGLRGVGEPAHAGRRAAEFVECEIHEALLNLAFGAGPPWRLLCPYDLQLPAAIRDVALRTHPVWRDAEGTAPSEAWVPMEDGVDLATLPACAPLPPPTDVVLRGEFAQGDVPAVRRTVRQFALSCALSLEQADDLELAASELASNCVRHGGGGGSIAMWREPDAVVVEFTDAGRLTDPLVGRRRPGAQAEGGMGVYLAHQLCDLVQVRSGAQGTTVRVSTWVPADAEPPGRRSRA